MREFVYQIHCSTSANLTVGEGIILIGLGLLAWLNRRDKKWFPTAYSVFLIFYITLLRRAPGYNENIRLHLILYVPFGWTGQRWKMNRKRIIAAAFLLSVCCEELQYFTGRGMADVNDVLFNTLGAVVGAWIASKNLF